MLSLAELLKKDHNLPTILSAPTLTAQDKGHIVTELLKHMAGADKNETVKNFLKTLADNNRLSILDGICEKFGTLISVHRGEVEMVVTSAAVGGFRCSLVPLLDGGWISDGPCDRFFRLSAIGSLG